MPELRDYLKSYWSQRWMIICVVGIATITTVAIALTRPVRYAVSESFAVNRVHIQPSTDYQYDGYYTLLAVDQFAQTVISWFSTPSVIQEVYGQAKTDAEITSLSSLTGRFKVKKYSAQNIVIRFSERTPERASAVASAMRIVMEEKASRLNLDAAGKPLFEILGSEPVISDTTPNALVWAGAALVLSLGFALMIAALRTYLRQG